MYVMALISVLAAGYGIYKKILFIRRGKPAPDRFQNIFIRIKFSLAQIFFQKKTLKRFLPGAFHSLIFYPFLILFITTAIISMDYDLNTSIFKGHIYSVLSILCDIGGLFILAGVFMAYVKRFRKLHDIPVTGFSDHFALLFLASIVMTGFLVEGLRMAAIKDPFSMYSPVGRYMANFFLQLSPHTPHDTFQNYHAVFWWIHAILTFSFIALIPYTKFFHIFIIPANALLKKASAYGVLAHDDLDTIMADPDFEYDNFSLGTGATKDLSFKHRLDTLACISCGRCETVCPPFIAGHDFSPKHFINSMGTLMKNAEYYWNHNKKDQSSFFREIVGNAFAKEFVWNCRTCLACVDACPAFVEHLDLFLDIRRNEINIKGRVPEEARQPLKTIENLGNPFGPQKERNEWISSLDVPVLGKGQTCDILFFIGCHITFDPSKHHIAENIIKLLTRAGIDVAVLGASEYCCGDPLRLFGEEPLFQTAVKKQVKALKERTFKQILTACPHCYTMLKNEYIHFDGHFDVVHYTDFLAEKIQQVSDKTKPGLPGKVTFHDPCYLSRYHQKHDAPRKLLSNIPGIRLLEMVQCKEDSFCCGGGGGHFFMDLHREKKINRLRLDHVRDTGANSVITACPFCLAMFEDALKSDNGERKITVADITDLLVS